jgi:hypothetical protein
MYATKGIMNLKPSISRQYLDLNDGIIEMLTADSFLLL